jgi:hypothetical protein
MPTMDYEAAAARVLDYVESASHIHPDNKQLIHDYHRDMVLADISPAQQQKLLAHFKIITDHVHRGFKPVNSALSLPDVGPRRLNVALTRAEKRLVLVIGTHSRYQNQPATTAATCTVTSAAGSSRTTASKTLSQESSNQSCRNSGFLPNR